MAEGLARSWRFGLVLWGQRGALAIVLVSRLFILGIHASTCLLENNQQNRFMCIAKCLSYGSGLLIGIECSGIQEGLYAVKQKQLIYRVLATVS